MRLDFGGVAKGRAADAALQTLRDRGLTRALVNAGGDLAVGDAPPGEAGWRIGVAPLQPNEPPRLVLQLTNCGVATSGDAWQYVEIGQQRYSHIVDPRTGIGLTRRSSVTVIARTGQAADGLASAVSVLGPERGVRLIERQEGAACRVVAVEQDQVRTFDSEGWTALPRAASK
jgi:thiamine biosynthesis lipoprotein